MSISAQSLRCIGRFVGVASLIFAFGFSFVTAWASELADELSNRVQRDQAARAEGDFAKVQEIDRENAQFLRELLDSQGWPRISEVGESGARSAWLLAQHADSWPDLQKEILSLLYELSVIGEAFPDNAAYLHDRIKVAENEPQRFGTQGDCEGPGAWRPKTLENRELVDEYRSKVGLPPLDAYIERASQMLCASE